MDGERGQLRWRCRRGMKELDVLLERYFDGRYMTADQAQREALKDLLDLPDPVLLAYLMGRAQSKDQEIQRVVEAIRTPPKTQT